LRNAPAKLAVGGHCFHLKWQVRRDGPAAIELTVYLFVRPCFFAYPFLDMPVSFPPPTFFLNSSRSFYVVHHSSFLGFFLNTPEHSLHSCAFDRFTHRSATMAETTPLLSHASRPPHDHSIFLRVCHSPWAFLTQKGLLFVRMILAVYLTTALALSIYYECKYAQRSASLYPYYASTVSLVIQMVYYWITTVRPFIDPQNPNSTWLIRVP